MSWEMGLLAGAGICLLLLLILWWVLHRPTPPNRHTWTRTVPSWGGVYRRSLAWRIAHPRRLTARRSTDLLTLARTRHEQEVQQERTKHTRSRE